jgi:hypothetical protein
MDKLSPDKEKRLQELLAHGNRLLVTSPCGAAPQLCVASMRVATYGYSFIGEARTWIGAVSNMLGDVLLYEAQLHKQQRVINVPRDQLGG